MLEIGMELDGEVLNVSLKGKLDGMTFTEFEEQLESKRDEASKIVIDATDLEYVSSAGLRVIMSTELYMEKNNKERIKITNASDDIKEIIELCGFDQVIDME